MIRQGWGWARAAAPAPAPYMRAPSTALRRPEAYEEPLTSVGGATAYLRRGAVLKSVPRMLGSSDTWERACLS
jgi:hypothetical protein